MPRGTSDQLPAASVSPSSNDSAAVYAAVLETIGDAVIFTDLDGRIRYWNPGASKIFGYPADEMLGQTPAILYPEESPERLAADLERILSGQEFVGQWQGRRRDGSAVWMEVRTTVVRDSRGVPIGFLGVSKDVTEQRHENLEAVARLAGGVAHEANNQMAVVMGLAAFLLKRGDLPVAAREDIGRIRAAAEHTATITRQLLAFSGRQLLQPRLLDLNAILERTRPKLRQILGEEIELTLSGWPELPPVRMDQRQLLHILQSLAQNARDAMASGGTFSLETRKLVLSDPMPVAHGGWIPPGTYLELAVRDTGVGMDAETLTHLFQPFFTTKPMGSGTGLRLASVYGIVKQSGGYVFAESSPGRGACFHIVLPASTAPRRSRGRR